jgi:hypothetical protein
LILEAAAMSWRKKEIKENGEGVPIIMAMVGNFFT